MTGTILRAPDEEDRFPALTACTTKSASSGVLLTLFLLRFIALVTAQSGDSCPVSWPFTDTESCSVCQTDAGCMRSLGALGASCNKGAAFLGGSASQAKSFRCNFTAPAALSGRVAPGAFVRCDAGIAVGTKGAGAAGGSSAGCTFGLVVSEEQVVCGATQCTFPPQTEPSLVKCLAVDCNCLGGGCKEGYVANLVGNLTGNLGWGCQEPKASDGKPGPLSCTLRAASLPGGSATALCDVGQCLRTRVGISESAVAEDNARLIEFHKAFRNGATALPDWGAAGSDMCLWTGVSCDRNNRVVGLYLGGKGLNGSIPSPGGWILPSKLGALDLTNNSVHGSIPPGMALPAPLLQLILPRNQLSGSIPASWVLPQNLTSLDLAHNQLSGTVPSGWTLPSAITFISLTGNLLTGTLPVEWIGQLPPSLLSLALAANQLSGSVLPPGLSLPPALEDYTCYGNRLNGTLPGQWPFPPSIKLIEMDSNSISGTLPPFLVFPPLLEMLSLHTNALSGSIPSTWELPPSLVDLRLRHNSLSGTLPSWSNASTLAISVKPGNPSLCGKVPSSPTYTFVVSFWERDRLTTVPACNAPNYSVAGGAAAGAPPATPSGSLIANIVDRGADGGADNHAAAVIGSVIGGFGFLSACVLTAVWWRRTHRKHVAALDDAKPASNSPLVGSMQVCIENGAIPATPVLKHGADARLTPRRFIFAPRIEQSPFKVNALPAEVGMRGQGGQPSAEKEQSQGRDDARLTLRRLAFTHSIQQSPFKVNALPAEVGMGGQGGQPSADKEQSQESDNEATTQLLSKDALLASIVSRLGSRPSNANVHSSCAAWIEPGLRDMPACINSSSKELVDVQIWVLDFRDLQLMKQIGTGSFGRVYVGRWQGTQVAIKLLLGDATRLGNVDQAAEAVLSLSDPQLNNLRKEASLMAALRHPNILGFLGLCTAPPALLSEYCPRGSLYDLLRAAKQSPALRLELTWAVRLHIATGAALGMMYLHLFKPAAVLHRDLKSNNLLVADNWTVKVSDFNLSKVLASPEGAVGSSTPGGFGNPRWQAPEVLSGKPHSFASDVFSFGVVLYELLTWRTPWDDASFWQVMNGVIQGQRPHIPSLEELPGGEQELSGLEEYMDLMQRCWAQSPADRPSFAEVVGRLKEIAQTAFLLQAHQRELSTELGSSTSLFHYSY